MNSITDAGDRKIFQFLKHITFLLLSIFLISCGGGSTDGSPGSSSNKSTVIINLGLRALGAPPAEQKIPVFVDCLLIRVSAPDMATIEEKICNFDGQTVEVVLDIPNGQDRHFEVFANDEFGVTQCYGHTFADLDGSTIQLSIVMVCQDNESPVFDGIQYADPLSANSVQLGWNSATDNITPAEAIIYSVYRGDFSTNVDVVIGQTSAVIGGLEPETTYSFGVRAGDEAGNEDNNTLMLEVTTLSLPDTIPPQFGGIKSAVATSSSTIELAWLSATDNVTPKSQIVYEIFQTTGSGAQPGPAKAASPTYSVTGSTSFTATGLNPDTTYSYMVEAVDQAGNRDGNSAVRSATTFMMSMEPEIIKVHSFIETSANHPWGRSDGLYLHIKAEVDDHLGVPDNIESVVAENIVSGIDPNTYILNYSSTDNSYKRHPGYSGQSGTYYFTATNMQGGTAEAEAAPIDNPIGLGVIQNLNISICNASHAFSFDSLTGADMYRVTIFSPSQFKLYTSSESAAPSFVIPSGVMSIGNTYYIRAEAFDRNTSDSDGESDIENRSVNYLVFSPSSCSDTWIPTSTSGVPSSRSLHTAVWSGSEMIIWGGSDGIFSLNTGGRYDPVTDTWIPTDTTGAPAQRRDHIAVWANTEMIVWGGGRGASVFNTGGRYDPSLNSWAPTTTSGAPLPRFWPSAVWTGSEMIVWGGFDGSEFDTGGKYNPSLNSWASTSTSGAPFPRSSPLSLWTGSEMIIWGGSPLTSTGGKYDPVFDSWSPTTTTGAPTGRLRPKGVWTGSDMIIWGGWDGSYQNTGGIYDPVFNLWSPTTTTGAPAGRELHTVVWTGTEMIIWGGTDISSNYNTGGIYDPVTDSWNSTSLLNAPSLRNRHTGVWTGSEMIIWGGEDGSTGTNTGGRYYP